MNNNPNFTTWKDQGGNIGIQCGVCGRTHWTGQEPATDPIRFLPCANCQSIKDQTVREAEQTKHNNETEADSCPHQSTQPLQMVEKKEAPKE